MSIQAVAWALEQQIPARPKLVLIALANHANHTDGLCWPAVDLIAHEGGCSRRAVFGYIAALERNRYVEVQRMRGNGGRVRSNNYFLRFDRKPGPWVYLAGEKAEEEPPPIVADDAAMVEAAEHPIPDVVAQSANPALCERQDGEAQSANAALGEGHCDTAAEPQSANRAPPDVTDRVQVVALGQSASSCTLSTLYASKPSESEPSLPPARPAALAGSAPDGYSATARAATAQRRQAAIDEGKPKSIFVIKGSDPWKYWVAFKTAQAGRRWDLTTMHGDKCGWWFPTLYPPRLPADGAAGGQAANGRAR